MSKNLTYYAHSIFKYNTDVERYELSLIPGHIVNPNGYVDQTQSETEIMKACFELIDKCNSLAFSSLDGVLGKGVVEEIEYAIKRGKPVYYIYNNQLNKVRTIRIIPIENSITRRIYATFEWSA